MNEFLKIIGDLEVSKAGIEQIERLLSVKKMESSSWTSRKYHVVISSVFEAAKRWGYLSINPCRQVVRAKIVEV